MSKYHVKRVVLVTVILGLLTSVGLWFAMQQRVRPASRQTIILLHGYGIAHGQRRRWRPRFRRKRI